jgi:hypothetical protein
MSAAVIVRLGRKTKKKMFTFSFQLPALASGTRCCVFNIPLAPLLCTYRESVFFWYKKNLREQQQQQKSA